MNIYILVDEGDFFPVQPIMDRVILHCDLNIYFVMIRHKGGVTIEKINISMLRCLLLRKLCKVMLHSC